MSKTFNERIQGEREDEDHEARNKTIVLIHGFWMTPRRGDPFVAFTKNVDTAFSRQHGHAWGLESKPFAGMRRHSPVLGVTEILHHYEEFVRSLQSCWVTPLAD